jgi:hypothetical protein
MTMPISLDTYARLLAHLAIRRSTPVAEILAELSISAEDLAEEELALRQSLASAWLQRRGVVAMKFAATLGDELLKLATRPAAAKGESGGEGPVAVPGVAIPSFLQPAPLAAPVFAPPVPVTPAAPIDPPEPPAMLARPSAHLAGTMDADLGAIVAAVGRGALPFTAPTAAPADTQPLPGAALPPAPPSPPQRAPTGVTGTVDAAAGFFGPATPFGPPPPPGPPPAPGEIDLAKYPLALYAAIAGELARGEPREKVLAANHLTEGLYDKIAHAWSARFQREPQLQLHFNALARTSAGLGPRKS